MTPIIYSPAARAELGTIAVELSRRSRDTGTGDRFLDAVFVAAERYRLFPESGIPRDEYHPGLRCFVVWSYLVYYRVKPGGVEILRVVHGSRDQDAVFQNYDPDAGPG